MNGRASLQSRVRRETLGSCNDFEIFCLACSSLLRLRPAQADREDSSFRRPICRAEIRASVGLVPSLLTVQTGWV